MTPWIIAIPIALPWLGAILVWAVNDRRPRLQHALAVLVAVASGLFALALLPSVSEDPLISVDVGGVFGAFTLVPDGLGVFLTIIATVIGSLAVIFSVDYMHREAQLGRYYALVLLFIGAMSGLVLSGSMLFMFLFWEITAFCSYALISFHNDNPQAVAGGIKALIMTQLGGVGLLAGALIIYANIGSYQIGDFLARFGEFTPAVLGFIAFGFLAAAVAKSAQVPLHTWLPDAMEAPTPVTALIHAATMVNAGVYLLARFYPAFADVPGWAVTVAAIGLLSTLLAGIMAMVANDLKRALAYSTVSQLGVMVYAVGVGAIFASRFRLMSHAVFKALLFLACGVVIEAAGTRDMRRMGGLGRRMPFTRAVFVIGSLALVGLPITNGFFSKELVLEAGLGFDPVWLYMGILIGVIVTALYTSRMVWLVFYAPVAGREPDHDGLRFMRVSLTVLAVGVLTTWLLAGPFSAMLAETLPYHEVEEITTWEMVVEILTAPATYLALAAVLLGIALWLVRGRLTGLARGLEPLARFAANGLGFESLNRWVVRGVQESAVVVSRSQTGQLNWNVVGIAGALLVVLGVLLWSIR